MPGLALDVETMLSIADTLPVMIGFIDRTMRYRFVNQTLADWLERPREELIGRHLRELVNPANLDSRYKALKAALNGERQQFVAPYFHPTRGPMTTQMDYVPHVGVDGRIDGAVLIARDITEQRATELALRESEARFRRLADFAPVAMWVTRADGTREFVNRAYSEFSGADPDVLQRRHWSDIIHPEHLSRVTEEVQAGQASGQPYTIEAQFRRSDGSWRWLRSVSSPRLGPNGELLGFIGVASDITVAKEAEIRLTREVAQRTSELAESESRFRAIFDSVQEAMLLLDPSGTVIEVNRPTAVWRSPNQDEALGKPLWEAPSLAPYSGYAERLREGVAIAARGEIWAEVLMLEGSPGSGRPSLFLDVTIQPVRGSDGAIDYLLCEARDISELKLAQDQLRQSQKMEALGQLTGGIAHDFNNLLTVVVGGLDLITKQVSDPKLLRYATNALSAAERGVRLTGQLLTFSRSQRLEVRPCLVAPLIEEMRPLLRNVLGPGIQKTFDLDQDEVAVMADPTQLEVAVLNLAINARDAMPAGGVLSFVSRVVQIQDDPELNPGDYIELAIGDTGTGMSPDIVARAFEPFFTTKEVGKGTGLGLSMVYGMARQSGGTARVESTLGQGTVVKLYFRRAEGGIDAGARAQRLPKRRGAKQEQASVVVVDDDPDVRAFVVASLVEQGFKVDEAADGQSGVALIQRVQPDVVVLDYVMPGMSGGETAAAILADRPDQPILFVSGYSETDDIRRAAPAAALLAKPFRPDALASAIRELLQHSRKAKGGDISG